MEQVVRDKKWWQLISVARLFQYLPFIDLVFGSGSLVLGRVRQESDLDVLTVARSGRLYIARFFCLLTFGLLGKRTHMDRLNEGLCFNHILTKEVFRLPEPHYEYDHLLYNNLVPIYGSEVLINEFYQVNNDWLGEVRRFEDDLRYYNEVHFLKRGVEALLSGKLGDWLEGVLMKIQLRKIKRSIVRYSNEDSIVCCNEKEVKLWFNPNSKNG
ncbi:TPA: hypothetical protein DGT35_01490 [Patescibacteria group bacterium]|jgi:hypothetical protein|nr:hypothetical protein [Patescibacteria group bacterium]